MEQYVKINIKEPVRAKLKQQAADKDMTLADYIEWLANTVNSVPETEKDEADAIMDRLEHVPTAEDQKIMEHLMPGELPECCQEIYSEEDPKEENMCEHWERAWVNFYGKQIWSLRNRLTGGSYQDYMQEYLG